ncbi:MAG: LON peptidase substrate-binding domain-containing protein, partial [Candidatus Tectomicrobia bacterium]
MIPSTPYPVLPLQHTVLFPHVVMPVTVMGGQAVATIEAALTRDDRTLVAAVPRDPQNPTPAVSDLYPTATLAVVARVMQRQDNALPVLLQGVDRVTLAETTASPPYLQATVTPLPALHDASDETIARFRHLQELVRQAVQHMGPMPAEMAALLMRTEDPAALAYVVATMLNLETEPAMALLATDDLSHLLQQVYERLTKEVRILELQQKIAGEAHVELDKTQREYVLRQQLKQIQKELGEDDGQSEVALLRQRLEEADLPPEVRSELEREVSRLQRLTPAAPDYQVARSYLEFALELPWTTMTTDQHDIAQAQAILNEDHFGLDTVKERIIEHLAVMHLKSDATSPILCFVGPPGVGKTSLGHSIARALGRRFERFSLGGVHDEAELRGHRRTYIGALPGHILQAIRRAGVRNPVLMLDEVDKLGRDFRGDPASALLEVLDPAQNQTFRDHYLDVPFDLSHTLFICTANTLETIPGPLLDRMEILTLPGYSEEEKLKIARQYLIPRQVENTGLQPEQLPLTDLAIRRI